MDARSTLHTRTMATAAVVIWCLVVVGCLSGLASGARSFHNTAEDTGFTSARALQDVAADAAQDQASAAAPAPASNAAAGTDAASSSQVNMTEVVEDVRHALREPKPHVMTLRTEFRGEGSSINTGESYDADTLIVQFFFNPCSGTQLHHHSNIELMQAIAGSPSVGIINPAGALSTFNFTVGQVIIIPSGYVHYYLNRGCQPAMLVATWPAGTKTLFELTSIAALPPSLLGDVFATPPVAPKPKPGFPIIRDPACLQRCKEIAKNATPPPAAAPAVSQGR